MVSLLSMYRKERHYSIILQYYALYIALFSRSKPLKFDSDVYSKNLNLKVNTMYMGPVLIRWHVISHPLSSIFYGVQSMTIFPIFFNLDTTALSLAKLSKGFPIYGRDMHIDRIYMAIDVVHIIPAIYTLSERLPIRLYNACTPN